MEKCCSKNKSTLPPMLMCDLEDIDFSQYKWGLMILIDKKDQVQVVTNVRGSMLLLGMAVTLDKTVQTALHT